MEKIFSNKNVLGYVLNYLEISDFLNLELSNSIIKSCVDFYYEIKNSHFELDRNQKLNNDQLIRKNSKIKKQNITKYKKNYISKYLNSFVVFPINEEFDEEDVTNEKLSLFTKEDSKESKIDSNNPKKSYTNSAKFYKNCINSEIKNLRYFFDSSSLVKQIFYSNEKLFFFYTSDELRIFSLESIKNNSKMVSLNLNKKNVSKVLYNEENFIFFALSEEGKLYKFYYPTEKTLLISEKLEKEKKDPLVKRIINNNCQNLIESYYCSLIKMNYDESNYTDIYLMKNYLIVIDKNHNIFYLNIEDIKTDLLLDEENTTDINKISEGSDSSKDFIGEGRNSHKSLTDKSNFDTNKKERKILNNYEFGLEKKKSDESLNKDDSNLINLDYEKNSNDNLNKKSKYEGYFDDQAKTNFHDILVKLNQNYNKIVKLDCSESNLLFSDEDQKLYYIPHSELSKDLLKAPKLIADTKLSNITEISCGDGYFMILEREDLPPLEKWTESEVYQWFKDMKLDEYLNIIKYEKIKGLDLINADEAFFLNNMGMEDDIIAKMKYEINQLRNNSKCKSMKLWGWGSNKNGQLGQMDYYDIYLKNLTRINLPEMKEDLDFIVSIKCLKNYSVLLTKFGEIFITGNYSMKKKSESISSSNKNSNNNVSGTSHTKDKKNKRDRKDSNVSNSNQTTKSSNNKWVNITKRICFDVLKENVNCEDLRQTLFFKARNIIATNSNLFVFGYKSYSVPFTLQDKLPKLKHLKKGEKFPTSDQIIDQVLKKSKKNKEKFLIIYDDAKLKFLETSLSSYLESEVPYHKVLQIKYYNEVIWDRKKRYYKYDY